MALDLHSPADFIRWFARHSKRLVVLLLGLAVLGAGIAMLVLPGPGILVLILGFAILATEFAWAERALDRTTAKAATAASTVSANIAGRIALAVSGLSMVVGGALVAAFAGGRTLLGASVALAGVIGLATLLPAVQRWLDRKATPPDSGTDHSGHATSPISPIQHDTQGASR
ncbi:MAG: PGPGW domain-containing protein [Ilumatobacteraceae bacterium]